MARKELWLFTIRYPFGTTEPFLGSELPCLARHFDRVRIFPLLHAEGRRAVPANVEVEHLFNDPYAHAGVSDMLKHWSVWRAMVATTRASAPSAAVYRKHWREMMGRTRQALARAMVLRDRLLPGYDPRHVVLYSYWTADWATVLGLLRIMDPRVRFISRMLGFDLFDHRAPDNWQLFQAFHLDHVDRVYTISQAGLDHLLDRYPHHAPKFALSHLATVDHGPGPWAAGDRLRLVSCSNLVPLKRVHLIAEALMRVKAPVHWTHFGDGPERSRIEAVVARLPAHIQVRLHGALLNDRIIEWYRREPVDLFVHVSSTEGGAPVALQEAASFGIPLLGADAGGVREIINDHTGELLPHAVDADLLTARFEAYAARGRDADFRQGVRAWWHAHFNAAVIHEQLARELAARLPG